MPLTNFGAILNFAEEIERRDMEHFLTLASNPNCSSKKALFEQFAKECKKNIKTIGRTRRENVTEMILEPIRDFTRQSYGIQCAGCDSMEIGDAVQLCKSILQRADAYYAAASVKLRAQPEAARALKKIGKKRKAQLEKL